MVGNSRSDSYSLSCSKGGHANADAACSNADAEAVGSSVLAVDEGSTCEHEELGKLACSKRVLEQEHNKVQVRGLEHSKAQGLEHSKELVRAPVHNMVLELALVHSKVLVLEQAHNKVLELEQVHNKVLVQVRSKVLGQGKLACNNEFAEDDSNAHALGGCEVGHTS